MSSEVERVMNKLDKLNPLYCIQNTTQSTYMPHIQVGKGANCSQIKIN